MIKRLKAIENDLEHAGARLRFVCGLFAILNKEKRFESLLFSNRSI
jgi:hypothetical protein